ncbi:carboxypeptidase-like regulatory domain-containing protein [Tenacibaculum sp. M341]|uniref:carboxypeptidase-like regulatory domain-containing protein n=1 Tax=Tenacibaculum sp. M341 TaxID=2530339 RepID=UPI0010490C9B|nr:carboxypeptidase-like regulatory domain-containing protein [Tenacibaculum sp. M341]TCI84483.1 carboxypeptidase-like regulatory domain-containing protein [Tenacibaculum sp. M341]
MKRKLRFTLLLFLIAHISFSQIQIKGVVSSEDNQQLQGAYVFFNNTTFGTVTNKKGGFSLAINEGKHTLIIAHLGYETIQYEIDINEKSSNKNFTFLLKVKEDILDEVVINSGKRKKLKQNNYNLKKFKKAFLGETKFAKKCSIDNPEALKYYYNESTKTFTAKAVEPLIIINKSLGYKAYYNLEKFELRKDYSAYFGFVQYKELAGKDRDKKRWQKNRLTAYKGSRMHFFRTIISGSSQKEGFSIDLLKKYPNKNYPTDKEIDFSERVLAFHYNKKTPINFDKKITKPRSQLDSAIVIKKRSTQKRYIDSIIQKNIPYESISFKTDHRTFLTFKNFLKVTYTKEKEESNYNKLYKSSDKQVSSFSIIEAPEQILPLGKLTNPANIIEQGYWAFERFANSLPLDYQPPKEE